MRVLGVDPGSRRTGFAVVQNGGTRIASGVIRVGTGELSDRLARIHAGILGVIAETAPDVAALEAVFSARNPRSALVLGQARGAALAACGQAGLPTAEYAASQIKVAVTGHGAADKGQVRRMVRQLLRLDELPGEDEADALAAAICHGRHLPRSPTAARDSKTDVRGRVGARGRGARA